MALKAGRVGVAKDQVDEFGKVTGGTPDNVYTKTQCDNKFETKAHIGGLQFRDNDGVAQYKLPNGEWVNFSSGGSGELLPYVDCSSLSPEVTVRNSVVYMFNSQNPKHVQLFTDNTYETPVGEKVPFNDCVFMFMNAPRSKSIYYKLYKSDGTTEISSVTYSTGTTSSGAWKNTPSASKLDIGDGNGVLGGVGFSSAS